MLDIEDLEVRLGRGRRATPILGGITTSVAKGRTLGIVGESGSGKSTLAKTLVGLIRPSAGTVRVAGIDVHAMDRRSRARLRRQIQMIPQDPYSSLDPRRTIGYALAEAIDPRHVDTGKHQTLIRHWLEQVHLPGDAMHRYPHEFSGGQRQRIAIARGLVVGPSIVVADEITSALDVSVQAEILRLLDRIRTELGLTMLFISHNLAVVRQVSDDVAVLHRGRIVEQGTAADVLERPRDGYTRALLDAVPGTPGFTLA
ncbi:ABC transporter ATP-binding protein [Rhodococcus sp. NPDC003348]